MPANTTNINVNVNFNGVTFDPNTGWSGQPTWNVNPDPANVPPSKPGNTMTLQWNLNASAVPSPFQVAFAPNGIAFYGNGWTGGPPSMPNSTTISADDTFDNLQAAQDFQYSISVVISGLAGGNLWTTHTFTKDPDVENQAGQANFRLTHRTDTPAV